jgi:hypothetical protein
MSLNPVKHTSTHPLALVAAKIIKHRKKRRERRERIELNKQENCEK